MDKLQEALRVAVLPRRLELPGWLVKAAGGQPILDARAAITSAGQNALGFPLLALAAPWWEELWCCVGDEGVGLGEDEDSACGSATPGLFPRDEHRHAVATVPTVPMEIRPARFTQKHTILYEPQWSLVPQAKDPALLRHLRGSLYAIEATWDLTKTEAAALALARSIRDEAWQEAFSLSREEE